MKISISRTLFLILVSMLTFQNFVFSQIIKPGAGVGQIKLGMTYSDVVNKLGQGTSMTNLEQETDYYTQFGYELTKEVSFFVGFDQAVQYTNEEESILPYPVYKLFFKNDKLVFMTLTSYGFSEDLYSKFSFKKNIEFMSSEESLLKVFGKEDQSVVASDGSKELLYLSKGVEFTIDEGKLRAVHLFAPLTSKQKAEFLSAFN